MHGARPVARSLLVSLGLASTLPIAAAAATAPESGTQQDGDEIPRGKLERPFEHASRIYPGTTNRTRPRSGP